MPPSGQRSVHAPAIKNDSAPLPSLGQQIARLPMCCSYMGSLFTFRPLLFVGWLFGDLLANAGQRLEGLHEIDAGQRLQGCRYLGHDFGDVGRDL